MKLTRTFLLLSALPLGLAGCAGQVDATAPAKAASGPGSVVAVVEGASISWEEMERRANDRLIPLRQDEYDARRAAIDEIAYEKLLARLAEHRGLSTEALLRDEIDNKLTPVPAPELARLYEQHKARFAGRTKEDAQKEIERAVGEQRRRQREAEFRDQLFGQARITLKLEAPRVDVEVPANAPSVGAPGARITLIEFSDYQCPYCYRAQETVDEILKQYDGKVRFVHREFPIPGHPRAFAAATAARCANEQGRFWDYHKNLLSVRGDMENQDLLKRGASLSLDGPKLAECLASGRFDADVNAAVQAARRIGVNSTPTFFINGRMLKGALPFPEFQRVLDEELARAGG